MKRHVVLALAFFICINSFSLAQNHSTFTQTIQKLYRGSPAEVDELWNTLTDDGLIPFVDNDSVAFLYRGEAKSVVWMGDFNGWGYDKKYNNIGKKIPNTNLWILKTSFPRDARIDYKILINDSQWILDPANQNQQWSGVGGGSPNSELRMPEWKPDGITERITGATRGTIRRDILADSKILGYQVMYSVYFPPQYKKEHHEKYPVIYVTDGYEYMHEHLGNMITVLDNLIHLKKIKPVIAIFVDNREPVNRANNRKMQELAMNEKYLNFFTEELIPMVEAQYPISQKAAERAILGSSMGGLTAAYFSFSKPEIFGLAGIQSPAFWFRPEIFTFCDNPENPPVKTFMTTGLINDRHEAAEKMKNILQKNTCTFQYKEVNQGHSWGNWKDMIDDILIYFFPVN